MQTLRRPRRSPRRQPERKPRVWYNGRITHHSTRGGAQSRRRTEKDVAALLLLIPLRYLDNVVLPGVCEWYRGPAFLPYNSSSPAPRPARLRKIHALPAEKKTKNLSYRANSPGF